jgi:Ni2+-binding GTPase involved in maturation of urease and hydrogenase
MNKTTVLLTGGFLGAGKTTLMRRAVTMFAAGGKKVGVITNDQAANMVDTRFFLQESIPVQEVSGSCFCCNFNGLTGALQKLRYEAEAEVILAESVGSCTDISATIMQPLKEKFHRDFTVGPLSVVLDPTRLCEAFPDCRADIAGRATERPFPFPRMHESAAYIVRKQVEEADILLLNKKDTLSTESLDVLTAFLRKTCPQAQVLTISALNDEGMEEWSAALAGRGGGRLARIDYDIYAEGEAALGWLNAAARLKPLAETGNWRHFCECFMRRLNQSFQEQRACVGHVKIFLWRQNCRQGLMANSAGTERAPFLRGELPDGADEVDMLINARVELTPDVLQDVVRHSLDEVCVALRLEHSIFAMNSLTPGRPEPTWRYDRVIEA